MQDGTRCRRCESPDWRPYGGYRRKSGERVARVKCTRCGAVRIRGVAAASQGLRAGPRSPRTAPTPYERFWDLVLRRFTVLGLPRALRSARREVGVDPKTVACWVEMVLPDWFEDPPERALPDYPHHSAVRVRLLMDCLLLRRGVDDPLPRAPRFPLDDPVVLTWADSDTIWQRLYQARLMAAALRGAPMPAWLDRYTSVAPEHRDLLPPVPRRSAGDIAEQLAHALPDQPWHRQNARHWLQGWESRRRRRFLKEFLAVPSVTEGSGSRPAPGAPKWRDAIGPVEIRALLAAHPAPPGLDIESVELALEWLLRARLDPSWTRDAADSPLHYWLVQGPPSMLQVQITTRHRLVGRSDRVRLFKPYPYRWDTQRLDPASIKEEVGVDYIEIKFGSVHRRSHLRIHAVIEEVD